jgi:hypothetical protein
MAFFASNIPHDGDDTRRRAGRGGLGVALGPSLRAALADLAAFIGKAVAAPVLPVRFIADGRELPVQVQARVVTNGANGDDNQGSEAK